MGNSCCQSDDRKQYVFRGHQANPTANGVQRLANGRGSGHAPSGLTRNPSGTFRSKSNLPNLAAPAPKVMQSAALASTGPLGPAVAMRPPPTTGEAAGPLAPPTEPRTRKGTVLADIRIKPAIRTASIVGTLALYISPLDVEVFESLDVRTTQPAELPLYARGKHLNRYSNVLPNPLTRVRLTVDDSGPESEYINANYVRGYGDTRAREYIAAQGPTPNTLNSFVRMIWEKKVCVIVMATRLKEGNKDKCVLYWPREVTARPVDGMLAGRLAVCLDRAEKRHGYTLHYLTITDGKEQRKVHHFWYHTWPDHGVPTKPDGTIDPGPTIALLDEMRDHRQKLDQGQAPALIHCSAGIGRTGTLIAIDQCLQGIRQHQQVDLNSLIARAREDRMGLVQHTAQYRFAYQACVTYAATVLDKSSVGGSIFAIYSTPDLSKKLRRDNSWKVHSVKDGRPVYALASNAQPLRVQPTDKVVFSTTIQQAEMRPSPEVRRKLHTRPLEKQPWFRTGFSRQQVEETLQDAAAGTFLVRASSRPDHYALSVQQDGERINMLIVPVAGDNGIKYKLGENSKSQLFDTVIELVHYLMKTPYLVDKSGKTLLLRNVTGQDDDGDC